MSRPERIEYPGAYYHVMNRGRRRESIFSDVSCYEGFLSILADTCERFDLQVHAYCLMGNHYHLLVSTPNGELQRAMRHLGGVYTQFYNRKNGVDGSLFKGRYKSILIDSDEYLLHLSKYIHLNPLEANMVDDLQLYPWSSYPAYIGKRPAESWLIQNEVYGLLTSSRVKKKRYKAYVEQSDLIDDVADFYDKQRLPAVLGGEAFRTTVQKLKESSSIEVPRHQRLNDNPSIKTIIEHVADYYGVKAEDIVDMKRGRGAKNFPRKVAMFLSAVAGGYKLTEIADEFGLSHYGGVGSAINAVRESKREDVKLVKQLNAIVKRFDP